MPCGCSNEKVSQSKFSPGLVSNNELVARILLPLQLKQFEENGFNPTFLSCSPTALEQAIQGIASSSDFNQLDQGFSVQRLKFHTLDSIHDFAENVVFRKISPKPLEGYVVARVGNLRRLRDKLMKRQVCILDKSEKDNPQHAEITKSGNTFWKTVGKQKLDKGGGYAKLIRFQVFCEFSLRYEKSLKRELGPKWYFKTPVYFFACILKRPTPVRD